MARAGNPNREKAFELYKEHSGNITNRAIAEKLQEDEKVIAVWKSRDKWSNVVQQRGQCCTTKKRGGQRGNKNAVGEGAPPENKNAEKHGLFSKYLPAETLELVEAADTLSPLDVLWHQITIQYAAIIRSQRIMHVKDQKDKTVEKVQKQSGKIIGEKWEVQQAWDKQANYLQAQARAMTSLNGMIKTYDELLHKNWDLATEEQRARIDNIKANTAKLKGDDPDDGKEDDGFIGALKGGAAEIWQE